ncbi:hypothetical protein [Nocardia sp. NPDC056100]|uniref:hypothetical protein n=1 Tax=Nocardia sp. NPDC056100 TaxID=3345712 RepID=UPI0035DD75D9
MTSQGPARSYGPERSVKPVRECRDVYELLDQNVRPRPALWVRDESLRDLEVLLFGYSTALRLHSVPEDFALDPVGSFAWWLRETYGWSAATVLGWARAIEDNLDEGETAMSAFFRLLDEYRAQLPK